MTENTLTRQNKEFDRFNKMWEYDSKYKKHGLFKIAGVDEAGRGALAGPVVSAAVILNEDFYITEVNDSKKLSPKKREILFDKIIENCTAYSIDITSNDEIDRINILRASLNSMGKSVGKLKTKPSLVLVDGNFKIDSDLSQELVIKGDSLSISIAAASILAKVTRDRLMISYDAVFEGYSFAKHKGYGTKEHINAIRDYGISPIHRKSFLKKISV